MDLQTLAQQYKTLGDLCVRKPRVATLDLQTLAEQYKTMGDLCVRKPRVADSMDLQTTADHCERKPRVAQTKTHNSFAALSFLTDDAEELLAAVSGDAHAGRVVEAVVDSGAVHSVTPPGLFPGPTVPSPWSRAGRGYRAANGTGIKNLGQISPSLAWLT
jgi:ABC-type transport system involved in Fe-S cluster assembly fused permease/ATPase subunit